MHSKSYHSGRALTQVIILQLPYKTTPEGVTLYLCTLGMVVDRGLEPAILCVRGRPPDHLEESTINKALNLWSWNRTNNFAFQEQRLNHLTILLIEFAVRAFYIKSRTLAAKHPFPLSLEM